MTYMFMPDHPTLISVQATETLIDQELFIERHKDFQSLSD